MLLSVGILSLRHTQAFLTEAVVICYVVVPERMYETNMKNYRAVSA